MGQPRPLFHLFSVFSNKHYKFLQQIHLKKCPSSLQCRDLNSQPLERESPLITTRPGLPPNFVKYLGTHIATLPKASQSSKIVISCFTAFHPRSVTRWLDFFNIWPFATLKIMHQISQSSPAFCQLKNKTSKFCQRHRNFCQSQIWSHCTLVRAKAASL